MIPFYIDGCFAVLHPAAGRRGVVICGTLSDDSLNAYRSLVCLAEQLAAAGIPALRISYPGTADSRGEDGQSGGFNQWLGSIRAAASWLCDACQVATITLIGHRVGASLAAQVAADCQAVDSLVLLNPISGRLFLHELTLAARISQRVWGTDHKVDDGVWFEAHGLRIDRVTRDALRALDVRSLPTLPAERVLVLEPEQRQSSSAQVEALQRLGAETTLAIHPDLEQMQRDSHGAAPPLAAFETVRQWLGALPALPGVAGRPNLPITATLALESSHETPIRFGPQDGLFGIFAAPTRTMRAAPAMLLVNTSANPRWGNARIAVDIARALAADGIPSLRMDAAGMGDAALQTGELGRPYAEPTTQDVLHAVEELARRTRRPVVILGICSGAYHALQAAHREARIGGLVLVNLQRFVWNEGDPSDIVRRTDLRPTAFYLRNILDPRSWYRLLRAEFDVARLLRVLLLRILRRAVAAADPLLALLGGATHVGRVRDMMRALGNRGVPTLYLLGCNDPGVEELATYFGRGGRRLQRQSNVAIHLLEGADHTLGAATVRAALIEQIRDWCQEHWLSSAHVVAHPRRHGYRAWRLLRPPATPANRVAGGGTA